MSNATAIVESVISSPKNRKATRVEKRGSVCKRLILATPTTFRA